jgi:oligoendopeptidase F
LDAWLADWTRIKDLVEEIYARLKVALDQNTADSGAEARYHTFLDTIHPAAQALDQQLKEKLLASGLEPENFANPLRRMRAEANLFRLENLPLLSEERKLASRYDKIIGAQTVAWQGQELTLQQLRPALLTTDRAARREVWQRSAARQLADRAAINTLWVELMALRGRLAANAGLDDYRLFRWQQMLRLDYKPEDGAEFQAAIEAVVVPAATRRYGKHCRRLGVEALRPWDLEADLYPLELPALPTYGNPEDLARTAGQIFRRVDPQLGEYFAIMQAEGLLDLKNRKGKSPGAYSIAFPASRRPFIFMNAVGLASDVRTLLHEAGHAFHSFERMAHLPFNQQRLPGLEFAEVASMAMELLASPYLTTEAGGFYTAADAARFRIAHLERILFFWPYMAVVDAFNNWVYTHHDAASDPAACDARWLELWERYLPGVEWSGLQDEAMTGWHRKQHIFRYPFYYLEYGLAQLGAVQIWQNALRDQPGAVQAYRKALALGGTVTLPELYAAAGAKFAFDAGTLAEAVKLLEENIERLESGAESF